MLCVCEGEIDSFVCEERGFKVRRKASTPSKFHSKGKRSDLMASKQANEINNKESKADSTGMTKEGKGPFFLCEAEEEGFKEAKESTKREKRREGNQHP